MNFTILTFDTIDSTNTEALKHARTGAVEGLCIIARQQTAGRGRHGRTWVSDEGSGLYMSLVLRPKLETRFLPLITLMGGIAVHDALVEFDVSPDIKWVNDVLVNEKKISGILAETTETSDGVAVVVGMGINLRSVEFPPEIANTATSVKEATGRLLSMDKIIPVLIKFIDEFYDLLQNPDGPAAIVDEWRKRSTYYSGKRVSVSLENRTLTGVTDGLEANGALRLRQSDGSVEIIQAGDVERLRTD